jgi:ACR3 family arsenite transporter
MTTPAIKAAFEVSESAAGLRSDRAMRSVGSLLSLLGGHGPVLLVLALCAGAASRPLAHFGHSLLPVSAFLLTLGSFLTAAFASSEANTRAPVIGVVLVWVGVVLPLAAATLLTFVPLEPSLRAGVLLSLLAPPIGSAAAIAAILGLQARLALVVSIVLTLLAPLSIPSFAALLGLGIAFNMGALAVRLFSIIGVAALVAFAILMFRSKLKPILPDQRASAGVAVVGLMIVGLATAEGVRTQWISDPSRFEAMLGAAIAVNIGLCALSALAFLAFGLKLAGTIGLVSGNRNVTLAWAAASFGLPPLAEGYVAACVVPVLALPLAVKLGAALPSLVRRLMPALRQPSQNGGL